MRRQIQKIRQFLSLVFFCGCIAGSVDASQQIRVPARAGQFYPGSKKELSFMIRNFLDHAEKQQVDGRIVGMWVPHAGYSFSGQIAANAYRQVEGLSYDAVIIIGPSHYVYLNGGSIGEWDAYETPLGNVAVDTELADKIRSLTSLVTCKPEAHKMEHSVETQIPFLQTVLPDVPIVPMVVGQLSYSESVKIASAVSKAAKGKNVLLVASSDMSHFPDYETAYDVDLRVLNSVSDFKPRALLKLQDAIMNENIPGLDCALCGSNAVMTVMLASEALGADRATILPYANSGDATGERHRVVGYGAALFSGRGENLKMSEDQMLEEIDFSRDEKLKLLDIARNSILHVLNKQRPPDFNVKETNLNIKRGVFVTLMNRGRLRGCIGHFEPDYPLWEIVSQMAVAAATQDYRFMYNPVTVDELKKIDIKISILSELKKIDSIEEIEVGKHGIWIKQNGRGGTYLPEVATELGWNRIEFLEHCCVEKAGLPSDAWKKGADVYIYTSQILDEKEILEK